MNKLSKSPLQRRRQRGSYFVEFSLAFWPLFVLMLDIAMPIFLRSAFTNATREGVRYGTTFRTMSPYNHTDSIKRIVIQNSAGFLEQTTAGMNKVEIKFYNPTTFVEVTGGVKNADGNIVEVAIVNHSWSWILPIWGSAGPITFDIRSADRLETLPRNVTRPIAP